MLAIQLDLALHANIGSCRRIEHAQTPLVQIGPRAGRIGAGSQTDERPTQLDLEILVARLRRHFHELGEPADLSLDAALELEKQAFSALFGSSDQKEGMSAFVAKRPARFTGR